MKKHWSILLVLASFSFALQAQRMEVLKFQEVVHDFGTLREENGAVTHEFSFINHHTAPVKILQVRASCGCTTPAWSKDPIAPGASGFVQAQYNPKNRPGAFNKSLTITTDYDETPIRLYIKGSVVPKPKAIKDELPISMGMLRFKFKTLNMGKIYTKEEPTTKIFEVYNQGDSAVKFLQTEGPTYIQLSFEPEILNPKEKGKLLLTYDAKARNDLGFLSDNVVIVTNETAAFSRKSFNVYATLEEYFPPLTKADLANAARLSIEAPVYDFGKIKKGEKVNTTFLLTNNGKSPLSLRKTKANCTCTSSVPSKETLQPGESGALTVTFDATGRRGNQQKSVTIFSNDPLAPTQRITIKAYVME